ncbi:MAG: hypothetical protein GXY07_14290 [Candidatus Hydrogenedentes bacterium]|nr:hypothetical protein [Candidatus Hydrogenedentota bacterium]
MQDVTNDRRICALKIGKKSSVLAHLKDLQASNPSEYNKILNVVRLVSKHHEIFSKHVKQGKGIYKGIYEMRSGQVRLFYFIDSSGKAIVVCTNLYWKAKSSPKEQNQAFKLCLDLRTLYNNTKKIETP